MGRVWTDMRAAREGRTRTERTPEKERITYRATRSEDQRPYRIIEEYSRNGFREKKKQRNEGEDG